MSPRILITGNGADALAANYVLVDLGYSPTIVTPYPNARQTMFANGPWRHTGNSKLLARVLDDLELERSDYTLTTALDGEDWSGKRASKRTTDTTLFDRFPDIKRILNGDDRGFAFDREQFVDGLRETASLSDTAIRGRPFYVIQSQLRIKMATDLFWFEPFDHLIVTDEYSLLSVNRTERVAQPQVIYKLENTSFDGKRFDSNYYAEGDVIRVTTHGDVTYVQTNPGFDRMELRKFGGKLQSYGSTLWGADLENSKPVALSLPPNVHALGSAATGIDQTISDVMNTAHNWGKQWKA